MENDPQPSMWQGRLIRMRGMEPADWETYFSWNSDDEQARALHAIFVPQSRAAVRLWAEQEAVRPAQGDNYRFVIARLEDDAVVGNLTVHEADPRVGTFGYGISIKREERRKGYASEAILLALRFYFEERRYQKATVIIFSFNQPSIALHERLGFQLEGRVRHMVYTRGAYYDHLIYGLTVEEFHERHSVHDIPI
jgi:RimJ/RimL family protein N-acetyltransferase